MTKIRHSEEFKRTAVQKYFSRGNSDFQSLAAELNVAKSTLWGWVNLYKNCATTTSMTTSAKRPQDWSPEQRIRACFEYEGLNAEQQGEFLRREGLHSSRIKEWRTLCLQALSKQASTVSKLELNEAHRKIKELERDLARKNSALAESSALLILKKKADLIWGSEEEK